MDKENAKLWLLRSVDSNYGKSSSMAFTFWFFFFFEEVISQIHLELLGRYVFSTKCVFLVDLFKYFSVFSCLTATVNQVKMHHFASFLMNMLHLSLRRSWWTHNAGFIPWFLTNRLNVVRPWVHISNPIQTLFQDFWQPLLLSIST